MRTNRRAFIWLLIGSTASLVGVLLPLLSGSSQNDDTRVVRIVLAGLLMVLVAHFGVQVVRTPRSKDVDRE